MSDQNRSAEVNWVSGSRDGEVDVEDVSERVLLLLPSSLIGRPLSPPAPLSLASHHPAPFL